MLGDIQTSSDGLDMQNEKDQQQQENNSASPTMIVEQIDGSYYTFDTSNCALMLENSMLYMEAALQMNRKTSA
jgi:hypothetical protein